LAVARRNGKILGRGKGSTLSCAAFLKKHPDIIRLLRSGQSIRNTAKIANKHGSTVQKLKANLAEKAPVSPV
jgi:transposase-like protein